MAISGSINRRRRGVRLRGLVKNAASLIMSDGSSSDAALPAVSQRKKERKREKEMKVSSVNGRKRELKSGKVWCCFDLCEDLDRRFCLPHLWER